MEILTPSGMGSASQGLLIGVILGPYFGKPGLRASMSFLKKILVDSHRLLTFQAELPNISHTKEVRFEPRRTLFTEVRPSEFSPPGPPAAVTTCHKSSGLKQYTFF